MLLASHDFDLTVLEAATCTALKQITENLKQLYPSTTSITGPGRTKEFALVCGGWIRDKLKKLKPNDFDLVIHSDLLQRFVERLPTSLQSLELAGHTIKATITRDMQLTRGACSGLKLIAIEVKLFAKNLVEAGKELEELSVEIRELGKRMTMVEDCKTRDFTVNSLYFGPSEREIFDLVGGIEHVEKQVLSCVESAELTFNKDFRRYIRAVRFQVEKGYRPDAEIEKRIEKYCYRDMHSYHRINEFVPEYIKVLQNDEFHVDALCELLNRKMILRLKVLKPNIPALIQQGTLLSSSQA